MFDASSTMHVAISMCELRVCPYRKVASAPVSRCMGSMPPVVPRPRQAVPLHYPLSTLVIVVGPVVQQHGTTRKAHEASAVGLGQRRRGERFGRRSLGDDTPSHEHEVVGGLGLGEVVGGDDDRATGG